MEEDDVQYDEQGNTIGGDEAQVAAQPPAGVMAPAMQAPAAQAPVRVPQDTGDGVSWAYAGSRLPGEPPVRFPNFPPGGAPTRQLAQGMDVFELGAGVNAYRVSAASQARERAARLTAHQAQFEGLQAQRDAQLLNMMVRVARSSADIERAMQAQDVIGFRNAVAGGTPPYQALQLYPRAATAPLVSGLSRLGPQAAPPAPREVTLPSGQHVVTSGRYGERVNFPPTAGATAALPPQARTAAPIKTAEGKVIAYDTGRGRTVVPPQDRIGEMDRATARALESQLREIDRFLKSREATVLATAPGMAEQVADAKRRKADLQQRLHRLMPDAYPAEPASPAPPAAAKVRVRRKSDGREFLYPGTAGDIPADKYEVVSP